MRRNTSDFTMNGTTKRYDVCARMCSTHMSKNCYNQTTIGISGMHGTFIMVITTVLKDLTFL